MIFKLIKESRRKKRLGNKFLLKTVYHELGHLFIALLFDDIFPITRLIIDKKEAKKITNHDLNGVLFFNVNSSDLKSFANRQKLISISLAGMCSQNLFFIDEKEFEDQIKLFVASPDKNMNNEGAVQDIESSRKYIRQNAGELGVLFQDYVCIVLKINFEYLSRPDVWSFIKKFANAILLERKLIFDRKEILLICNEIGFDYKEFRAIYFKNIFLDYSKL